METRTVSGRNPVLEYLRGEEAGIRQLIVSSSASGKPVDEALVIAKSKGIKVITVQKNDFLRRFGDNAQGIVLELHQTPLKEGIDFEAVAKRNGSIIILDQISDPHNLGAIIRSAEALASGRLSGQDEAEARANPLVAAEAARLDRERRPRPEKTKKRKESKG